MPALKKRRGSAKRRSRGIKRRSRPTRRRRNEPWWVRLSDEKLLDVRMSRLQLRIEGSPLEPRVQELYEDLERVGLRFRPSLWLSTDWFSPEGVPGLAIPFYLAHPRLARLERAHMLEVEGGTERWFRQLLRHETGHALDSAYRLHHRASWRRCFGRAGTPYRASYIPRPASRRFVHHLDNYYAQSHPLEDFAETFAVWLGSRGRWRKQYAGWPALKKLEYVDEVMRQIRGRLPKVRVRERMDSLPTISMTLGDYYRRKMAHYGEEDRTIYDRDLCRLFTTSGQRPRASKFLRENRVGLRRQVARWTGQRHFVVDEVIQGMMLRSRELGLRLAHSQRDSAQGAAVLITMHTTRIQKMRHREYFR